MTIKVLLVGAAHIHTPGFIKRLQARSDIAVRCVWDHIRERAGRLSAELNARWLSDLRNLGQIRTSSAAIICSETNRHEALVTAGAAAGKHLFVEKPLGLASAGCLPDGGSDRAGGGAVPDRLFHAWKPNLPFRQKIRSRPAHLARSRASRMSNCHAGSLKGWFDTEWRWMARPVPGRLRRFWRPGYACAGYYAVDDGRGFTGDC